MTATPTHDDKPSRTEDDEGVWDSAQLAMEHLIGALG